MSTPTTSAVALQSRRAGLMRRFSGPTLIASGMAQSRNFRANEYRFRASSHFLYFVGRSIEGAALLFNDGEVTLFTEPPNPDDALWHGPRPELATLRADLGLDAVKPSVVIDSALQGIDNIATVPTEDARSAAWLSDKLGRMIAPSAGDALSAPDDALAEALVALRLIHDDAAIAQLRHAAKISAAAHIAGMKATSAGGSEYITMAAMVGHLRENGLDDAYGPIVTVAGEVLHSNAWTNRTRAGDLLLADVGGETAEGWAADITRTWPVSGTFSATQRAIYDVVLDAQHKSLDAAKPGRRYRDVHEAAKRAIVEGLVSLKIFSGDVDGLLERGAAALFFPHGIGHLLGLDVHDMEDLGDRAGYAAGRQRSAAFGDAFLRLDRDLEAGMAVTIEPGFYQVPGILDDPKYTDPIGADLNRSELDKFGDVRGIRIEDDVLITEDGHDILTSDVPKDAAAVEAVMAG